MLRALFWNRDFGYLLWAIAIWATGRAGLQRVSQFLWAAIILASFLEWSVRIVRLRRAR